METTANGTIRGSHGDYRWLLSNRENMNAVLRQCPDLVVGKYVAITTYDSGTLALAQSDRDAGWQSRGGIAYSQQITRLEDLPGCAKLEPAELYQEWFMFRNPVALGRVSQDNVWVTPPAPNEVVAFVNYCHFALHDPQWQDLIGLFWQQMDRLRPESYFGEGDDYTTFATDNRELFERVLPLL